MKTAVLSVVYPDLEPYFPEFLSSLSMQTEKGFILYLINDGLPNVEGFLQVFDRPAEIKEMAGKPAALRKLGIEWVIEGGADIIIFADADDYFDQNRIEISKRVLKNHHLVFNELMLVGKSIHKPVPMLGAHFHEGEEVLPKHLKSANCMGLSNTALKVDKIPQNALEIPDSIIAFDWALFSMCLHSGCKGVFTENTRTYYRQYENNVASLKTFTEEKILRGVEIKRDHYRVLARFYEEYSGLAETFEKLLIRLKSDLSQRKEYCRAVREKATSCPLWWEAFKSPEELGL